MNFNEVSEKHPEKNSYDLDFDPNKRIEKTGTITEKTFNPNERIKNDVNKLGYREEKNYDPNKRIKNDVVKNLDEIKSNGVRNNIKESSKENKEVNNTSETENQKEGLTQQEKEKIKKETGWSDEIINHIENMDQYEIYKNANLHEAEINGKKCLVKNIDMDYVDPKTGLTNRELMQKGRSPIDSKTGEKIELHHMGQDKDGPFAELCENSEHGDGNHSILHPKTDGSWRNEDGANANYDKVERPNHWKARAQEE